MKKVPHKFVYTVYSDYALNCEYSPYERKYNYSCAMNIADEVVLCHVASNDKEAYIASLRQLAGKKREAHMMFCTAVKPKNDELPLGISILDKNKMRKLV